MPNSKPALVSAVASEPVEASAHAARPEPNSRIESAETTRKPSSSSFFMYSMPRMVPSSVKVGVQSREKAPSKSQMMFCPVQSM